MKTFRILFSLLIVAGVHLPGRALAADPAPPVATIIQQAIARDAETQKALETMQYRQTLKTERLNDKEQVTQRQELQMVIRPGTTQEIQVVSEKGDDLPSNPDQAALQAQGKKAQAQKVDLSLKDLAGRFTITLVGTTAIAGQAAYELAFEPKPDQPYHSQTEKVLNHLHGHIWIRAGDYTILKTEATLAEPVEVAWVFAEISELNFHYELDNTTGGLGPARVLTSVRVDAPFLSIRQRTTVEMTQFQPRGRT
jgi:hypothetical protein